MTAANALKYYEMRSTAKQTRSLGQRFMDYLNDNVVYFASARASCAAGEQVSLSSEAAEHHIHRSPCTAWGWRLIAIACLYRPKN